MHFGWFPREPRGEILQLEKRVFPAERRAKICKRQALADLLRGLAYTR